MRERKASNDTTLPKPKMVEATKILFDTQKLFITANCTSTISQLGSYVQEEVSSKSSTTTKFGGHRSKDDHVS